MSDLTYDPASHYDRVTDAWRWLMGDELHYGLFEEAGDDLATATRRLTDRMVDAAAVHAGDLVLDIGCGTGAPACHLAMLGAYVTGISTSTAGLAAATARAAALGLGDRTTFEARDGMDTQLPGAAFDVVWVLESSHLMRDRGQLIAECARLLRPGGRLALCDLVLRRTMALEEVKRLRPSFDLLRWAFGDARMEPLETYRERMTAQGLDVQRADDLTAATRPTFAAWRGNAARYAAEAKATLGADGLAQFIEATEVLEGFWDDGTLGYGLLRAVKPTG
ncbi:MAG TPA: methyltransferase domain-containing protein [Acidimicrobiales bacterium]